MQSYHLSLIWNDRPRAHTGFGWGCATRILSCELSNSDIGTSVIIITNRIKKTNDKNLSGESAVVFCRDERESCAQILRASRLRSEKITAVWGNTLTWWLEPARYSDHERLRPSDIAPRVKVDQTGHPVGWISLVTFRPVSAVYKDLPVTVKSSQPFQLGFISIQSNRSQVWKGIKMNSISVGFNSCRGDFSCLTYKINYWKYFQFLLLTVLAYTLAAPTSYVGGKSSTAYSSPSPIVTILKQISQYNDDGSYTFGYENSDGSFRIENMYSNGYLTGRYGYIDSNGQPQETGKSYVCWY